MCSILRRVRLLADRFGCAIPWHGAFLSFMRVGNDDAQAFARKRRPALDLRHRLKFVLIGIGAIYQIQTTDRGPIQIAHGGSRCGIKSSARLTRLPPE
jgi:hypothetical protein